MRKYQDVATDEQEIVEPTLFEPPFDNDEQEYKKQDFKEEFV